MRSTLEILIAVQESRPVEPEELRLALYALDSIHRFTRNALDALIEAVEGHGPAKLRAAFARDTREQMFRAMKTDPAAWLGPDGIPGTPGHDERLRLARAVGRAAGLL